MSSGNRANCCSFINGIFPVPALLRTAAAKHLEMVVSYSSLCDWPPNFMWSSGRPVEHTVSSLGQGLEMKRMMPGTAML